MRALIHVVIKLKGRQSQEEYSRENVEKMRTWKRDRKENRCGFLALAMGDSPIVRSLFSIVNLIIAPIYCELTAGQTLSSQNPIEVCTLLPFYI